MSVVMPAYNFPDLLERSLAGFTNQTLLPDEIIVVDDGSQADLQSAVNAIRSPVPTTLLRQEFEGNGAGPARNLGAAHGSGDIVLFCDSDCIPDRHLVARHAFWHNRARRLVVAGARFHIDSTPATPEEIAGSYDLGALASTPDIGAAPTEDWRRHAGRRHRSFTIGTDIYRSCLSSNLSVERETFLQVGGFSDQYVTWGAEDTELGWRLWNNGAFIVPDDSAVVFHQIQHDPPYDSARQKARNTNRALMADRIPERFYRKHSNASYSVPKLTWIASVGSFEDIEAVERRLADDHFADVELILVGPPDAVDHLELLNQSATRTRAVVQTPGKLADVVMLARGEFVLFMDARVGFQPTLVKKSIDAIEKATTDTLVRAAYRVRAGGTYRRLAELQAFDEQYAGETGSLFTLVRKRELLKDPDLLTEPVQALAHIGDRGTIRHLVNDHIELPEALSLSDSARPIGRRELAATTSEDLARLGVRAVRKIRDATKGSTPASTESDTAGEGEARIGIDYIGYAGSGNFGDELMLHAIRQLMPWADIAPNHPSPQALMVGGGTLINVKNYYVNRIRRNDSPRLERIVFGTGVRNPDFWGATEDSSFWTNIIKSSLYAGVRGPHSQANLRQLGHLSDIDILGDPALTLTPPTVERVPGRVVICPVWTSGELHGGSDEAVFAAFAQSIRTLIDRGHEVIALSAFASDDRWLIELMRSAGAPNLGYVASHTDVQPGIDLIASADLVIAERLHAAVVAAAVATPFIPVEYRPKTADFAASVGVEELVVRTDDIGRLDDVINEVLRQPSKWTGTVADSVRTYRNKQRQVAESLSQTLSSPDPQPWVHS